jgi:hypothetical protein
LKQALSGNTFGALVALEVLYGLPVFEVPEDEKAFKRYSVPVRVVAQPEIPVLGEESLLA